MRQFLQEKKVKFNIIYRFQSPMICKNNLKYKAVKMLYKQEAKGQQSFLASEVSVRETQHRGFTAPLGLEVF